MIGLDEDLETLMENLKWNGLRDKFGMRSIPRLPDVFLRSDWYRKALPKSPAVRPFFMHTFLKHVSYWFQKTHPLNRFSVRLNPV